MASAYTEVRASARTVARPRAVDRDATLLVSHCTSARVAGLGLGFELLLEGLASRGVPHSLVDLASVGATPRPGTFRFGRAWRTAAPLLRYLAHLPRARRVYLTVATSQLGFLRDAFILWNAYVLRRRVIIHLRGGGYRRFYVTSNRLMRALIRATLVRADAIVVLSESLRTQFRFLASEREQVVVVPNGLPELNPALLVEQKTLPKSGPVRLLYLSNMIPSKGYWELLRACRTLRASGIDIRCDFAGEFLDIGPAGGDGPGCEMAERQFRAAIREWRLVDRAFYHGVVRGAKKVELLRAAHLFVLPTYYPWEGQPLSIIEAMAAATPVISTRHRAIPDQVVDGHNGFLVQTRSPAAIATAVTRLATEPSLFAEQSRNAYDRYRRYFSRDAHLDRLIGVILHA